MRNRRQRRERLLNGPDRPLDEKQKELEGNSSADDKTGYIDQENVDDLGELTLTDIYEAELAAGVNDDLPNDPEQHEFMTELELRAEETDDPNEAVQEGYAYVPPIDPPTTSGDRDDLDKARMASGLGVSSLDEPYDAYHHSSFLPDEDDVSARVRDALRADSKTSRYADEVDIDSSSGVVTLRGEVDDLVDEDSLIAVTMYVAGVTEVVNELHV